MIPRCRKWQAVGSQAGGQACRKLTPTQAQQVILAYAAGFSQRKIAQRFGVSKSAVRALLAGKTYKEAQ